MSPKSFASSVVVKRAVVAAGAALVLAGSVAGVAGAQQAPTPTATPRTGGSAQGTPQPGQARPGHEQFISTLASKLGVTVDRLNQAIADTRSDLGLPPGGHFGPGGPGHRGGPGGPGFGRGASLDVAAQAIGITPEQLRQELPGKSLADVARAHNVDPTRVANALKADANAKIDQAVTAGRLTADQATQAKQRASQEIDEHMNRVVPAGRQPGQPGRPGGQGPQGRQGQPGQPGPRGTATPGRTA